MLIKIGTRSSGLALAQAEEVKKRLEKLYPQHTFVLCPVSTTADKLPRTPMRQINTTGMFVKELEEALLEGSVDMAVHSMKDLPSRLPEGLLIKVYGVREDPRDALILSGGSSLTDLKCGAVIGTGSLRRKYQLLRLRPDLQIADIRGNVTTRLKKMEDEQLDGLILASAGLKRLGIEDKITGYLSFDEMIPAPAQGAIAVEMRAGRPDICDMTARLTDVRTDKIIAAERSFLDLMDCGCRQPVGAIAEYKDNELCLRTMYAREDGTDLQFVTSFGQDAYLTAKAAADQMKKEAP